MEQDIFNSFPSTGETKTELDKVRAERDYWKQKYEEIKQYHNNWVVKMQRVCGECNSCAQASDKAGLKLMESATINDKEDDKPAELQSIDMAKQAKEFEEYSNYYRNLRKQFTQEDLDNYAFDENPKNYNDLMYAYHSLLDIYYKRQKYELKKAEVEYQKKREEGTLRIYGVTVPYPEKKNITEY